MSSKTDVFTLAKRVVRLERLALILVSALVVVLLVAQGRAQKSVQAARFVVVDGAGKERAVFGMKENVPELTFRDANGKEAVRIFVENAATGIVMTRKGHTFRLMIGVDGTQSLVWGRSDAPLKWRLAMLMSEKNAVFQVYKKDGMIKWSSDR